MSRDIRPQIWRRGSFVLTLTFGLAGAAIWIAYDALTAPRWMRAFAEELAMRATVVSTSTPTTAFSTMKGRADPDSPYICFGNITDFKWDRVYFIPSGGPVPKELASMHWKTSDVTEIDERLARDDRYQLIVFTNGEQVSQVGYYFTIWGDISALGQTQGFDPESAVFVAESDGETYTVLPVDGSARALCPVDQ